MTISVWLYYGRAHHDCQFASDLRAYSPRCAQANVRTLRGYVW
jgi:hypothetical protein